MSCKRREALCLRALGSVLAVAAVAIFFTIGKAHTETFGWQCLWALSIAVTAVSSFLLFEELSNRRLVHLKTPDDVKHPDLPEPLRQVALNWLGNRQTFLEYEAVPCDCPYHRNETKIAGLHIWDDWNGVFQVKLKDGRPEFIQIGL